MKGIYCGRKSHIFGVRQSWINLLILVMILERLFNFPKAQLFGGGVSFVDVGQIKMLFNY